MTMTHRKFAIVSNGVKARIAGASFVIALFAAQTASAQLFLMGSDLRIVADPTYPAPGERVRLVAESSLLDLSSATIAWMVDGKVVAQGVGEKEIETTASGLGKATAISVHASESGSGMDASLSLIPGSVDLLFDATSYVPPFYRGRALPSPGSALRLVAVPHIYTNTGPVSADKLMYTWRQDGEVLGTLSGRGKSSATIPAPPLFGASDVSVEVRTEGGAYGAQRNVRIPAIDPQITLYQDHPLFGILYHRALRDRDSVADIETTFAAVPYFVAASSAGDSRLHYAWSVNGRPLTASSSASNKITVNAAGASGPALLSLALSSAFNYYLDAEHAWTISFARTSGVALPVGPATPADAFHSTPGQ